MWCSHSVIAGRHIAQCSSRNLQSTVISHPLSLSLAWVTSHLPSHLHLLHVLHKGIAVGRPCLGCHWVDSPKPRGGRRRLFYVNRKDSKRYCPFSLGGEAGWAGEWLYAWPRFVPFVLLLFYFEVLVLPHQGRLILLSENSSSLHPREDCTDVLSFGKISRAPRKILKGFPSGVLHLVFWKRGIWPRALLLFYPPILTQWVLYRPIFQRK